jgi:carbon dioxide concentrating mechanism protein CcmN
MHALSRLPLSDTHFFLSGTVAIDPSAAIAPGVLIQADPGARIVIQAGVCIGRGSIIHVSSGTLDLAEGVILGTGVLIFGGCSVGAGACIGANVTVISHNVNPGQLVPANSVLSTLEIPSEPVRESRTNGTQAPASEFSSEPLQAESTMDDPWADASPESGAVSEPEPVVDVTNAVNAEAHTAEVKTAEISVKTQRVVYGKSSLDQILTMMFPHRQSLNSSPPDQPDSS